MNKQSPGIEWTHVWGREGYTWNPAAGCLHGCRWEMPDGAVAKCYAETIAEGLARRAFPQGFGHHYWHPERLEEPKRLKKPAGIFLDSMSDLMGAWVPEWQVADVLDVCRETPEHVYFLLTKNPARLEKFVFPANVWVGVSSPPDWMHGKRLTRRQQERWLRRALIALQNVRGAAVRWASFEPLSWDAADIVEEIRGALNWAVIGAASNGRTVYLPERAHLQRLVAALDRQHVPVFFKGNLRGAVRAGWRENFPDERIVQALMASRRLK